MSQYTVTLSEAEDKALSFVAGSQRDWIDNAAHNRCRIAIDEIVQIAITKCFETSTPVPNGKEEIVLLAFEKGWVKSAQQRAEDADANNNLAGA